MNTQLWQDITPQEVQEKLNKNSQTQFIDVREPDEYAAGRIHGTKLIPLSEFAQRANEINPNEEVICICRSGKRSAKACDHLVSIGYTNVKNMTGGMLEWNGSVEKN
ncbi:rhodanese-like domain-containing protein [Paenibacillus sp. MMO-58]|uniref:rhodanese-like domain-containing protein n=1 Tax=Paenibacillus sp. MMO-58 TaxID=3081290 RepID=UPI003017E96D